MGPNGPVRALMIYKDALILGGQFSGVGDPANCVAPYPQTSTYCIAGWTGSGWFSLGDPVSGVGMNNTVMSLATFGTDLIAGGLFTTANGVPASHIAKWNGTTWSPLGAGLNGDVYALTTFGGALYAGGAFTKAGGTTVNYIAKWNGSTWSKVGSGMNGSVRALAVFNGALIAGGEFTKADNKAASRIAKWSGSAWTKLGSGTSATVFALSAYGSQLCVGGMFGTAGGVSGTSAIALWSGSAWSALGTGLNDTVMSLATFDDLSGSGTELYVGGYFTAPVGGAANSAVQIARWNDADGWSTVGSGMVATPDHAVFALSPNPIDAILYAGGYCAVANQTGAGYLMGYHWVP